MAPAAFLMGIGPIARWRDAPVPELAKRLEWAFAVAVLASVGFVPSSGRFGGTQSGSTLGAIAFVVADRSGSIRHKHVGPLTPEVVSSKRMPLVR
jgi:cytochrome c-type biogenesis protein CcmF